MIRYFACLAMTMLVASPLRAGELDKEFGGQAPPVPAVSPMTPGTATSEAAPLLAANRDMPSGGVKASELDEEMPSQAWHRRFGFGGFGRGFGYGGFGYGGFGPGFGYGGFGRGFGLSIGYSRLGFGYGGLGYGYGGLGFGGLGYGGLGYGGLGYGGFGYGGLGYGGGYLLAANYLGYGYGGFPGCYW